MPFPICCALAPDVKLIVQAVAADESQTVELYRRGVRGIISAPFRPTCWSVRKADRGRRNLDRQSIGQLGHRGLPLPGRRAGQPPHPAPPLAQGDVHYHLHYPGQAQQGDRLPVRHHRAGHQELSAQIYDKLGVSDRLELALYCLHNKIIQTDADEEEVAQRVARR